MTTRVELNKDFTNEIIQEEASKKRKKIIKILCCIFIPILSVFLLSFISIRFIGNVGIIVKEYPYYNSKINDQLDGIKIIHFSDIHYNNSISKDKVKKLISLINKTNPDIVIFTGDLFDNNYNLTLDDKEFFIGMLESINSKYGKYAVKGDKDNNLFDEVMSSSSFVVLNDEIKKIYINDTYIELVGGNTFNIDNIESDAFRIAMVHKPDSSDYIISKFNPDVIFAGHSNNGQIRLPFIGALYHIEGAKKYVDSYYKNKNTDIYISSGVGNNKNNFRLFNHPSFNFIRLKEKNV